MAFGLGMSNKKNIIIVGVFGVLAVSIATADLFMNREVNGSPLITAKVSAATLTYRRTLILKQSGAASISPTPTVTPIALINSAEISPTVASQGALTTPTPTSILLMTNTPTPTTIELQLTNTQEETPTPTLPDSGWTQVASIMFIAASIVLFLSFLF